MSVATLQAVGTPIIVADAETGAPVYGAALFNQAGSIVAVTAADGTASPQPSDYPLLVRQTAYAEATVEEPTDTLRLVPREFSLPDVTVSPKDSEVLRLTLRMVTRTTWAAGDTVHITREGTGWIWVAGHLGGKFEAVECPVMAPGERVSVTNTAWGPDSVLRDPVKADDWDFGIPGRFFVRSFRMEAAIPNSALGAVMPGRWGNVFVATCLPGGLRLTIDFLADKKDHKWTPGMSRLLGVTLDATTWNATTTYATKSRQGAEALNAVSLSSTLEYTARGKWLRYLMRSKKPVIVRTYTEAEITDWEFMSAKDAKMDIKDRQKQEKQQRKNKKTEP